MKELKLTLLSMGAGTGSAFFVAVPIALIIAFATGFLGVMGQHLAKWIIKKIQKSKFYEKH